MQGELRKSPLVDNYKVAEKTKRTTIILEKEEREFIDSLIRDGKETGIKPLISKMLEIYKSMMIQEWRFPGEYYCGISRTAFVNVELLNIMAQLIPREKWLETGRQMGCALKVCMETTLDVPSVTFENWETVFRRLKVQGYGDVYVKDKYLLAKTPFVSEPEILKGILEGLLEVRLDLKNRIPPLVFEVKNGIDSL
jgi:hypothetical protein